MSGSWYIVVILLETVLLGTVSMNNSTISPITMPTPEGTSSNDSLATSTEPATSPTSTVTLQSTVTSADPGPESQQTVTPDPGSTGGSQEGLTAAEAAGVAVGTIAGVAALGGGIYAGLKFSGKLG